MNKELEDYIYQISKSLNIPIMNLQDMIRLSENIRLNETIRYVGEKIADEKNGQLKPATLLKKR